MRSLINIIDFPGPFYPRPPPAPLPPPPPHCSSRTLTDTTDTAATVLASEAVYASLRGLESSEDASRNLVAEAGNSNFGQWQRRTNSAGNPNVYFFKSDPYRERHPGFIY